MYDDSWYSYVPETNSRKETSAPTRRDSLLNQPNGTTQPLDLPKSPLELLPESSGSNVIPKVTLARRAKSYSDFYDAAVSYLRKPAIKQNYFKSLADCESNELSVENSYFYESLEDEILEATQDEYQLYRDQLTISERHLNGLLDDTTSALDLLAKLSESFKAVESQTTTFRAQCEDLLGEQKHLSVLADEVGTHLQYYAYLEPLTRRLNAPGASRLVKNDDFLDILSNLNACIDFMDQHPAYRDSTVYMTRYTTLLERALNLVQNSFSSALKEISAEVSMQLRAKEVNETTEYILLYGKFETVSDKFGLPMEKLLRSSEFAFGQKGDLANRSSYIQQWHELYKQLLEAYLNTREIVNPVVLKNLRHFSTGEPKPESDFKAFARHCVEYVFEICHNELRLAEKLFLGGPLLADYSNSVPQTPLNFAERLEQARFAHITTLHNFLVPYLSKGDLHCICDLVNWLETEYLVPPDSSEEDDCEKEHTPAAHALLANYLWPLSDSLFIKAAAELEHFKPSEVDLQFGVIPAAATPATEGKRATSSNGNDSRVHISNEASISSVSSGVAKAYPTVKTAVKLLIMYNDSMFDRPKKGDVLYEIVHQALLSLQKAATIIKRTTTNMQSAQLFLIKNLLLISNLFLTHEIPDTIRQSAELDFSPVWATIKELQAQKQLFNPLAYITPLVKGQLLPAVRDKVLDARKELEAVLARQIDGFAGNWRTRLRAVKGKEGREKAERELDELLNSVFEDETTIKAFWRMIKADG